MIMSITAKMSLIKQVEAELADKLTAADMRQALTVLSAALDGYEVDLIRTEEYTGNDDLLQAFLSALQIEGRSEKTIERYRYILKRMLESTGVTTRQITVYHLRGYLASEKERGISDTTLEGNRQVYSAYFGWLHREGLIQKNPVSNLGAIKCRKKVKTTYSDVDIERLRFCSSDIRDRAIIDFLTSTGCRVSEMTRLNREDVDLVNGECKVLGKGDKERTVYLSQVACMTIRNYLNRRTDDHPALFIGKGSDRLSPHGVRAMLCRIADELEIENVHPHKFRRTLATNLIRHGMPIQDVATILGHDKLDTTMQYVVMDKTEVKHAYLKYA